MAEKKEKVVFWADPERTFGDGILFGEEVTGMIDGDRLKKWLDDGTVTEEKPESVAHASQTKLTILTAKVEELEAENAELKSAGKSKGKPSAKAAKQIEALEEAALEKDIEIENLTAKVKELGGGK